jgi:hypothetical protein
LISVFLSFCLSVFLSFCLSIFMSFCLSVFISFWDTARSWGILPVPGGYCPCLGDTARAWGILLHLMKGFTSSRSRVSMDPADRVPPTPATQWHHPASNHKRYTGRGAVIH